MNEEEKGEKTPIIGLVVDPNVNPKPKLVGIELSFYIGKRIFLATVATVLLLYSLLTIKLSNNQTEQLFTVENKDEPNLILGAVALYLLGVSTDLDLALPLKMLRGSNSNDGQ